MPVSLSLARLSLHCYLVTTLHDDEAAEPALRHSPGTSVTQQQLEETLGTYLGMAEVSIL